MDNVQEKIYGKIYRLTNKFNGKMYHGQTTEENINDRWNTYKNIKCEGQPKLYRALKKYGPENFLFEIIDTTPQNQTQLDDLEIDYIARFDSMNNGYNCTPGGKGIGKGHIVTKETRQKISKSLSGRKISAKTKEKLSIAKTGIKNHRFGKTPHNKGKRHSKETINKMRGRILSKETKAKMSKSRTGELNHNFGKHFSKETRQKISESNKGKYISDEIRQKISNGLKGHVVSIETKQKMSKARNGEKHYMFGRKHSDETRKRMSEAAKKRKKIKLIPVDCPI